MRKKSASRVPSTMAGDGERSFAVDLMEHLVVPTFVVDDQCRLIIWNRACERLTGVKARDVVGTRDYWRAFYDEPRPCLADLIVEGRTAEVESLYAQHEENASVTFGFHAENWCVMPQVGTRLYIAIDAGPIYDDAGKLVAVVETLRDMTIQKEAQMALQLLASRDGLTSVANRRTFDQTLDAEWRRAQRESRPLGLLMIDVDHFKRFNDSYGHQRGDDCLKAVAEAMSATIFRVGDLVARYGGEEFAVILPSTSANGTMVVAERIRAAVEALRVPHCDSQADEHITVSVGASYCVPGAANSPAGLLAAADSALYQAKHEGRNRVAWADPIDDNVMQERPAVAVAA